MSSAIAARQAASLQWLLLCVLLLLGIVGYANGHAMMFIPRSRNTQSYYADPNEIKDWNPNFVAGGGEDYVYANGSRTWPNGKWGVCGDKWDDPKPQRYTIPRTDYITEYVENQIIAIHVVVTAMHMGRYSFQVCPSLDVTEECFMSHEMKRADKVLGGRKWWYMESYGDGGSDHYLYNNTIIQPWNMKDGFQGFNVYVVYFRLPKGVTCDHCVLRWYWETSHLCTPSCVEEDPYYPDCFGGRGGRTYCGTSPANRPQEYWNCADIRILPGAAKPPTADKPLSPRPPRPPPPPPSPPPRRRSPPSPPPKPSPPPPRPFPPPRPSNWPFPPFRPPRPPPRPPRPSPPFPPPAPGTCYWVIPRWQKCGGLGKVEDCGGCCADAPYPGTCCENGYTCTRTDNWYWGCVADPEPYSDGKINAVPWCKA